MAEETDRKDFEFISESEWNGRYTYIGNRSRETVNELLRNKMFMVRDRLLEVKDIEIQALREELEQYRRWADPNKWPDWAKSLDPFGEKSE